MELTQELLVLSEEATAWKKEDVRNPESRAQIEDAENSLRIKRARWRIMKSVLSGIIVGSGVDWASDETLLSLVLDEEVA
jgi:hypothetical protein